MIHSKDSAAPGVYGLERLAKHVHNDDTQRGQHHAAPLEHDACVRGDAYLLAPPSTHSLSFSLACSARPMESIEALGAHVGMALTPATRTPARAARRTASVRECRVGWLLLPMCQAPSSEQGQTHKDQSVLLGKVSDGTSCELSGHVIVCRCAGG